ncbi:MAG TPA: hypothetical protein PLH45_05345 [Synergistales bacterium]|nr:hypothetical protein [Synergistales bacterium]
MKHKPYTLYGLSDELRYALRIRAAEMGISVPKLIILTLSGSLGVQPPGDQDQKKKKQASKKGG